MTALTADRNTPERAGVDLSLPVAATTEIFAGSLVALNSSGYLVPGSTSTTLTVVGRAEMYCNNTGSAGDLYCPVKIGVFRWANSSASDEITLTERGDACFIVDDQTVAKTSGSSTRSPAGLVYDVDSSGVWVDTRTAPLALTAGSLAAANNLSDVANAATARGNLGVFLDHMGDPVIAAPGAESGNTITVGVQLKTIAGADLAAVGVIHGFLAADAAGAAVTTLTIASLANGTDGEVIPLNAGLTAFIATSESDGDIDIVIGCTGTGTCYLVLVTPRGKLVASDAITFA